MARTLVDLLLFEAFIVGPSKLPMPNLTDIVGISDDLLGIKDGCGIDDDDDDDDDDTDELVRKFERLIL